MCSSPWPPQLLQSRFNFLSLNSIWDPHHSHIRRTETISKLFEKQYLNLYTQPSSIHLSMISFSLGPKYHLYSVLITH